MKKLKSFTAAGACLVFFAVFMFWNPSMTSAAPKGGAQEWSAKPNAAFDVRKMGDMSDFDPANLVIPTGDTIKIAVVASHSGPAALTGHLMWVCANYVAHDINKRGGLWVDGKKKLVQLIKADHMSRIDQCKKISERMVLQEKVVALWGTDGSHLMKVINEVANKYKVIAINVSNQSDDLMDATNFSRYAFHSSFSADQIGRGFAYYYGQMRKKETKFYILNQDYGNGHDLSESFKKGLKEYFPSAQIVGEDYHKLFATDFAPYLTKIKASGADVIFTGDWSPDAANLLKQARRMGVTIPFANVYMDEPNMLADVGVEGTKGLVHIDQFNVPTPFKSHPDFVKFYRTWNNQWKKWKAPYHNAALETSLGNVGSWMAHTYWFLSIVERAKTTDPEKIIALWEGDTYRGHNGKILKMRACDHKTIQDLTIEEYVAPDQQKISMTIEPYYWFKASSCTGPAHKLPAGKVLPWMDSKLDRCKGKNGWGN